MLTDPDRFPEALFIGRPAAFPVGAVDFLYAVRIKHQPHLLVAIVKAGRHKAVRDDGSLVPVPGIPARISDLHLHVFQIPVLQELLCLLPLRRINIQSLFKVFIVKIAVGFHVAGRKLCCSLFLCLPLLFFKARGLFPPQFGQARKEREIGNLRRIRR